MSALEGYDTASELNRKTFETLEWLLSGVDRGRITEEQFSVAIDALFMTVSGLVEGSFIEIVTEAQEQCSKCNFQLKRMFHHPDEAEIIKLTWTPGDSHVSTLKLVLGQAASGKVTELEDSRAAMKVFRTTGKILEKKGWIEL